MQLTKNQENFVKHVYQNSSFYIRKAEQKDILIQQLNLRDEWDKLPLVRKEELVFDADAVLMPECIPLWLSDQLLSVYTSGTTGMCLKVYWKLADTFRSLSSLWIYRKKDFGISPNDKFCTFYSIRSVENMVKGYECLKNQLGFTKANLTEERLVQIYNQMCEYEPKWLLLQPSIAVLLAAVKKKYNLGPMKQLKYIEVSGEILTEEVRKKVSGTFGCPVVNQYGSYEVNSIAYECTEGNLHCMEGNVLVEILDHNGEAVEDGMEGEICVTSFRNTAMPFIRYKIGDRGCFCRESCSCGRKGKVLRLTEARTTEWIITSSGRKINPYVLMHPIENINRELDDPVVQFQIIQSGYDEFIYRIVAEPGMEHAIRGLIKENIYEKDLAGSRIYVEFCECIMPDEETGKVTWFQSKIKEKIRKGEFCNV